MNRSDYRFNKYMYITVLVFFGVFGLYFYPFLISGAAEITAFRGLALIFGPALVSLFGIYTVQEESHSLANIRDKSIKRDGSKRIPLTSKVIRSETLYYPAINASITPAFSFGAVINTPVVICSMAFSAGFFIAMWGSPLIPTLPVLLFISIMLSWITNTAINIPTFIKIFRSEPDGYVDMQYAISTGLAFIRKQEFVYYHELGDFHKKKKDLLKHLLEESFTAARRINNLIAKGHADPKLLVNEVQTLEYIINDFIPRVIITTRDYFKQHKAVASEALNVYEREVEPKVHQEALALVDKLGCVERSIIEINKYVKQVDEQKTAEIERQIEASINLDGVLTNLTGSIDAPTAAFPEFHALQFKDDAKRAAANNIVSGALKNFVEAENMASNSRDKRKLAKEITEIKTFVRALASDTPESVEREARLIAKEQQDPLYIKGSRGRIDDVDNMIASNKYYIEAYDNTLPITKD